MAPGDILVGTHILLGTHTHTIHTIHTPHFTIRSHTCIPAQRDVGAIREAIASYSRSLELSPDSRNAGQNRLLALNYVYPGEDPVVCRAHEEWGARFQRLHPCLPPLLAAASGEEAGGAVGAPLGTAPLLDLRPDRPLVVGYVSPDFFTHSVSYFAEAPLTRHR